MYKKPGILIRLTRFFRYEPGNQSRADQESLVAPTPHESRLKAFSFVAFFFRFWIHLDCGFEILPLAILGRLSVILEYKHY